MFKTLQAFLPHKKNIYSENSISIEKNGVKLQLIKEIQISRHKAIYGQTLGRPCQGGLPCRSSEF